MKGESARRNLTSRPSEILAELRRQRAERDRAERVAFWKAMWTGLSLLAAALGLLWLEWR
jgi:hypothetical protein